MGGSSVLSIGHSSTAQLLPTIIFSASSCHHSATDWESEFTLAYITRLRGNVHVEKSVFGNLGICVSTRVVKKHPSPSSNHIWARFSQQRLRIVQLKFLGDLHLNVSIPFVFRAKFAMRKLPPKSFVPVCKATIF